MKKIIRLTESDLTKMIKQIIIESTEDSADIAQLKSQYGSSFIENKQHQDPMGFYENPGATGEPLFRATLLGVEPSYQMNGNVYAFIKPIESNTEKENKKNRRKYKNVVMTCRTNGFRAGFLRQKTLYCPVLHDFITQTVCKLFR